jgi:predicted membrane protein (TIGR00267 family)
MMKFELGLEQPEPARAWTSAATIGGSYALGGVIPLAPYMLTATPTNGLLWSCVVTSMALLVFGYIKGRITGIHPIRTGFQTLVVGALAAGAAFAMAKAISK